RGEGAWLTDRIGAAAPYGSEPKQRLLRRRKRDTSRGSPVPRCAKNACSGWQSALLAVVAAAAGDHDAFDGRLANQTGFAFAAVDAVLQLEEAFFAVGVHVI